MIPTGSLISGFVAGCGTNLTPARGAGEAAEELLVDPAERVLGPGPVPADAEVGGQVDHLARPGLVEGGPGVVPGEHALELLGVAVLGGLQGVIYQRAGRRLFGVGLQGRPAGVGGQVEDRLGGVLLRVFRIDAGVLLLLLRQAGPALLGGVGDVLEGRWASRPRGRNRKKFRRVASRCRPINETLAPGGTGGMLQARSCGRQEATRPRGW
jgi:hypothetical protein